MKRKIELTGVEGFMASVDLSWLAIEASITCLGAVLVGGTGSIVIRIPHGFGAGRPLATAALHMSHLSIFVSCTLVEAHILIFTIR